MTVPASTVPRIPYVCNGIATDFGYPHRVLALEDIQVVETITATGAQSAKVETTDWTVPEIPDTTGAYLSGLTIVANVAPAAGRTWTIIHDPVIQQLVDLTDNGALPVDAQIERPLDRLTLALSFLRSLVTRTLRQPSGDVDAIATLPPKAERASKFFGWDSDGNPIAAAGTSANLTPVSVFINTLLDDVNAAAARATLEVSEMADSEFRVKGSSDATKKLSFEVDALTTATTVKRYVIDDDAADGQGWDIKNLTLTLAFAANAVTISATTKNGTAPSATDPIIVKFRQDSLTGGGAVTRAITGALALAVSSGSTLGTVSGIASRIYIGICDDNGTPRLFVYNPLVSTTLDLRALSDDILCTSVAEGGAGAADSPQVIYSGTAFASKAIRLIGYMESTQATAGLWTGYSKVNILKPWDKRTGDIVQRVGTVVSTVATGTTITPQDNTIPQITEGDQYMTQSITPLTPVSIYRVRVQAYVSNSSSVHMIGALHQDAIANALAVAMMTNGGAAYFEMLHIEHQQLSVGTASVTFRFRAGVSGGTMTFNGSTGNPYFNGTFNSYMRIEEIMV